MSASLSMGGKILQGLSALFGIAMFAIGVLWLVAPGDAAGALGATLLEARLIAWQFHGAALTLDAIIPEIVMLVVTLSAARAMRAAG